MQSGGADERIVRGLRAQMRLRRQALDEGHESVGWKIGLNAPAVMEQLGISAPVIGFLTSASHVEAGGEASLAGAKNPGAEPEVAIHLEADVAAGVSLEQARTAIAGLGPAIEIVDLDVSLLNDLQAILSGNVFHRAVVLGERTPHITPTAGPGEITVDGQVVHSIDDVAAAAGDPAETVRHVAGLLGLVEETLRAGEVIIAGSLTPIVPVSPGAEVKADLGNLGGVSLALSH